MHILGRVSPLALALLFSAVSFAQEFRATITGRVSDPSGGSVPAKVSVRNLETNVENSVTAGEGGEFTIPFLLPGSYSLTAEAPGFKRYVQSGITLEVAQKAGFDIKLEVGSQTQSIEVQARAEILDTETASRGQDITSLQVSELPLNFRNPYSLISLMPGVEFRGNQSWIRPFDGSTNTAFSMNGGAVGVNEILIDGASNTTQGGSGTGTGVGYVPTVDSVTEIKVQTTPFDASIGRTAGGVSSLATKSGTNAIHGTVYEFYKRDWLDANSFHNKSQGILIPKQEHFLDQYGGEVDGPVFIPKIYNGRNKTFFTFSYEKYREGTPNNVTQSFPAPEFLTGDFSKLVDSAGRKITIYDPQTGVADPTNTVGLGLTRQPFENNIIPTNRLDPVALKIASYYPKPNCTTPGSAYSQNNFCLADTDLDNYHNLLIKIDHNLTSRQRIFFRYGGYNRDENRLVNGIVGPGENGQQPFSRISNSAIADWVGTINPTLIMNVHGSFTRFIETSFGQDNRGFDLTSLGFPSSFTSQLPAGTDFGVYSTGLAGLGRGTTLNLDNNYELNANLTKIWGSHSIRTGIDMRQYNYLIKNSGNILNLTADTTFTQQYYNTNATPTPTGYQFASFLLGAMSSSSAVNLPLYPWYKNLYFSPFVQDDWKVTPKLTLNLGLRWDANLPGHEKHDRLSVGFDPNTITNVGGTALKGGLLFAGVNGQPETAYDAYLKTVQFRVGGAYKLSSKMVLRAGYGVYYLPLGSGYEQRPGFTQSTGYNASADSNQHPLLHLSNPFPTIAPIVGSAAGLLTAVGTNPAVYNRAAQLPRTDQFSVSLQMSVTSNSVVDFTFGGSRGKNLEMTGIGLNQPSLAVRQSCNAWEGGTANYCDALLANPYVGNPAFSAVPAYYSTSTISRFNLLRPYPQFSGDLTGGGDNNGKTWYNSGQVNYKYRARGGLNIITNYTFSHWTQRLNYADPYKGVIYEGISPNDQTHQFKLIGVYQLPVGKGKHFLRNANRLVDGFLGGWEVNESWIVHSGQPINFPTNAIMLHDVYNNNIDWTAQRPSFWNTNYCIYQVNGDGSSSKTSNTNQASCPQTTNAAGQQVPDFTKYDWVVAPKYAPGVNSQQNGEHRLPRVTTMDASLNKSVAITERLRGQIRIEAFNVLNHFAISNDNIDTNPTSTTFGTITPSALGNNSTFPRTIQLGFKLVW